MALKTNPETTEETPKPDATLVPEQVKTEILDAITDPHSKRRKYVESKYPKKLKDVDGFLAEFVHTDSKVKAFKNKLEAVLPQGD